MLEVPGGLGLHPEILIVALEELIELEAGGEEVGEQEEDEDEDGAGDVDWGEYVDVGEELVAGDVDDAVHGGCHEPATGAFLQGVVRVEEGAETGLDFIVYEISDVRVVVEVVVLILLKIGVVEGSKRRNHEADWIRVIFHRGDAGLVGVGISCAVEVVEVGDPSIDDGGEVGGEDGDTAVVGSRLVDEVRVAVGDGEGEVVLSGSAGLGGIGKGVVAECLELSECDRGLFLIVYSGNDHSVGVDAVAVEIVLDGADDAAEGRGGRSQDVLVLELAELAEDAGVCKCHKHGVGVGEKTLIENAAQLRVVCESESVEIGLVGEVVGVGSAGVKGEDTGAQGQTRSHEEEDAEDGVHVPQEVAEVPAFKT